jgi:hypothetical protein
VKRNNSTTEREEVFIELRIYFLLHSAIFIEKIGSGTHSDTKFCRGGWDSYSDARKNVSGVPFWSAS